jgi:hypothetical protein
MPENNQLSPDSTTVSGKTGELLSPPDTVMPEMPVTGKKQSVPVPETVSVSYHSKNTTLSDDSLNLNTVRNDSINLSVHEVRETKQEIRFEGSPRPYSFKAEDGITSLLLMSFLLFTSVYGKGLEFIRQMTQNLFEATERDSIFIDNSTANEFKIRFFLLVQATILLAVFSFITIYLSSDVRLLIQPDGKKTFICILLFALVIFLFWGIKWMLNSFIGRIFFDKKKVNIWQNNYFSAIELLGIVLLPAVLFSVHSQSETFTKICMILSFSLIALCFILIIYKGFRVFLTKPYGIFYFILYLCALEFIPYMGLYMGLEYMYKLVDLNAL